ncbi:MAG: AAA family ATPase [Bacteroidales bacterium]|nr:AAA family ATPase [Bacteroidales bacterium]
MKTSYSLLAFNETLSLVIADNAKSFLPIVMKDGMLYDPQNSYKPIDAKPKQKVLSAANIAIADGLMKEALKTYESIETKKAKSQAAAETAHEEAPKAPQTPQTTLDSLIAQSVAQLSVNSVMEATKPLLDKYIAENFGVLPKQVLVKTEFESHKVTGVTGQYFEKSLKLVGAGIPTFLAGPAGCGKNVICKQVAQALGLDFYFSNAVTQEYKLTGFIDANGHYQPTQFYEAFTKGGLFMLDEMDASTPEVLVILNAAIANGYFDFPTGRVDAHKDFRIMAAGNTFGTGADSEYTGRFQLDASSLDRFAILEVSYEKDVEAALARGDKDLLRFIYDFRKSVKKANILFTVSYRAIERLSKLSELFSREEAIKLAVLRGMEDEDARMIYNNMLSSTNPYYQAFGHLVA